MKRIQRCFNSGPLVAYKRLLAAKKLLPDNDQFLAIKLLDKLSIQLQKYQPISEFVVPDDNTGLKRDIQKGFWLYGEVGTGKTVCLDLFYSTIPIKPKLRIHFHEFMQQIYRRINQQTQSKSDKVLETIARDIIKESWLICFDEFQITDIASGTIMRILFSYLLDFGAVIVCTSNKLPSELNSGSFQKKQNQNLANILERHCDIYHFKSSNDYRRNKTNLVQSYFVVGSDDAQTFVKKAGELFYGKQEIPKASNDGCIYSFDQLCGHNGSASMGPAEYLQICSAFEKIVIYGVPQMGSLEADEARRFITFIDAAYETKSKLIILADEQPENLFIIKEVERDPMHAEAIGDIAGELDVPGDIFSLSLFTAEEEVFAFRRAVSRLYEMQSKQYWKLDHVAIEIPKFKAKPVEMESGLKPFLKDIPLFDESILWERRIKRQ